MGCELHVQLVTMFKVTVYCAIIDYSRVWIGFIWLRIGTRGGLP